MATDLSYIFNPKKKEVPYLSDAEKEADYGKC